MGPQDEAQDTEVEAPAHDRRDTPDECQGG
jgi:hypothetical protein